jgi:tetratricopeptide (TPR) repeat protein
MTSNHLLLYRLAELMLQNESTSLLVDALFDDEQVGDEVKSIQIDSPFQQMLLEGVLTESVREEKLYVGFTVEGYFHYLLGEVIFNQIEGKGAEVLKQMVEENKLNGLKEGIEQCLIRDVNQDDLSRLMWLIDSGGDLLDICGKPLAHSFLNIKGQNKSEIDQNQAYKEQIKKVSRKLFEDPTDNDLEVLSNGIDYLEETQKNNVIALIYQQINELIVPDNLRKSILYVKSIMHLPEAVRNSKLQDLANIQIVEESDLATLFFSSLGQQFSFVGDYEKAVDCHEKSLSINLKIHGDLNSSIGSSYNNLGEVWREKGDYDKSAEYYEKSLAINLNIHGDQHSSVWESYNNLGLIWSDKGHYDKSIEYLEKSLEINFKIHGNHHLSTAITYNNLGSVWSNNGDYGKAIEYLQKTLVIRLKVYSDQHPSVGESYNNLGVVWNDKGDYDKAIEYYEKTLAVDINVYGDQHPSIAITYSNLGSVWRNKANYDNALNNLGKSLAIYLKVYGDQHPLTGITYTHFGNVFRDKKDSLRAKENYEKAYNIFFKALGTDHPHTKLLVQKLNDLQ